MNFSHEEKILSGASYLMNKKNLHSLSEAPVVEEKFEIMKGSEMNNIIEKTTTLSISESELHEEEISGGYFFLLPVSNLLIKKNNS